MGALVSTDSYCNDVLDLLTAPYKPAILGIRVLATGFLWITRVMLLLHWAAVAQNRIWPSHETLLARARAMWSFFDFRSDMIYGSGSRVADTRNAKAVRTAHGGIFTLTICGVIVFGVYYALLANWTPTAFSTRVNYEPLSVWQPTIPLYAHVDLPCNSQYQCSSLAYGITGSESIGFGYTPVGSTSSSFSGTTVLPYECTYEAFPNVNFGKCKVDFNHTATLSYHGGVVAFNVSGFLEAAGQTVNLTIKAGIESDGEPTVALHSSQPQASGHRGHGSVNGKPLSQLNLRTPTVLTFLDSCISIDQMSSQGTNNVYIPATLRRNCLGGLTGPNPYCVKNTAPDSFLYEYSLMSLGFNYFEAFTSYTNQTSTPSSTSKSDFLNGNLNVGLFFTDSEERTVTYKTHPWAALPQILFVVIFFGLIFHPIMRGLIARAEDARALRATKGVGVSRGSGVFHGLVLWVVFFLATYGRASFLVTIAWFHNYVGSTSGSLANLPADFGYLVVEAVFLTLSLVLGFFMLVFYIVWGLFYLGGGTYRVDEPLTGQ